MPWAAAGAVAAAGISYAASEDASTKQANSAGKANAVGAQQYENTRANLAPYLDTGNNALAYLNQLLGVPGSEVGGRTINGANYDSIEQVKDIFRDDYINKQRGHPGQVSEAAINQAANKVWREAPTVNKQGAEFGSLLKPFGMDQFKESPAYQFNLDQGRKAIDKAAAARGTYYAPQTLQDISKFSQGLASNEFQNAFSNYNTSMGNIFGRLQSLTGAGQNAAVQQGGFGQNFAQTAGNNLIGAGNAQAAGTVGAANSLNSGLSSAYNNYMTQQILSKNQQPTYGGGVPSDLDT